ncbi:biotin-dependent carboxyltransferase family protein [Viridibacillus sp. YIM B01967]|uniref:Biotin-dependent carboxyltransferase family protein n=1 Tax=Viridibacillus soli TaxID=2798301 RepID=A0ABS1H2X4_9BACL|nr:biotin-dependent carboxyltransferase family protein [Viridibacillus soli]MBK3493656.1 biotin-dependent carboxyltransferase family protein [Viridibacillus soli]
MTVTVLKPGLLTTIQDTGRFGSQKFGVIVSGAMDAYSLRIANILVGNVESEAALEVSLFGTVLQFNNDHLIALTGADLTATINGESAPLWRPFIAKKGDILKFKRAHKGCRAYVSFAGGIHVPTVMNSKSTYLKAGMGGFEGRALQKKDELNIGPYTKTNQELSQYAKNLDAPATWSVNYHELISLNQQQTIRVIHGTEWDCFTAESQLRLTNNQYTLSTEADRMGYRFEGPELSLIEKFELLSEAVTFGTVQIPPSGKPIILMADRQTTGGYPKMVQVITADLASLAQLQSGAKIQFKLVSLEEAQQALIAKEQNIKNIATAIRLSAKLSS